MDLIESLLSQHKPLTVAQVAEKLRLHPITIYKWTKSGKMPVLRLGAALRFDPQQLAGWLQARQLG